MKVVIVAKTRMRGGACVGAITSDGRSVRLIDPNQDTAKHFNLVYYIGEVWEIDGSPPAFLRPPHIENVVVHAKRRVQNLPLDRLIDHVERTMPPHCGGPEGLFDGLVQAGPGGPLFIAERPELADNGLPPRSTMFWRPDRDLMRDEGSKRIRYRYPAGDGGCTLTFVGFQEPLPMIPAGTLLRVSLAHWWRPEDKPETELRCYVQLSGWFETSRVVPCEGKALTSGVADVVPTQVIPPVSQGKAPESEAHRVLKSVFGYDEFLPLQADIIANVLARRDTLAIMPTGGGKSLCYQLPALIFDGLTVVVSPLIALMQDQVDALRELGVSAAYLNSTVDYHTYLDTAAAVREGQIKLLYLAPETLLRPETLVMLDRSNVSCLTIDEAHCISSWGHDFRPEYRQLLTVRQRYPNAVCLALTATATRRVQEDIKEILGFDSANEFIASFNRPNLFLAAQPRTDGLNQILAFLGGHRDDSGIIYCHTRKEVKLLSEQLVATGWSALPYHAGLDDAARREHQRRFSRDETQIIVATIAFGMGINKSNVRFILHAALPENIENYYQQIGRAGRDGLRADCLLLWGARDIHTIRHFIEEGPEAERPGKEARLGAMLRYAQTTGCRRKPLLAYFGENAPGSCEMCDNCLAISQGDEVETVDLTAPARLFVECVRLTGETFGPAHITDILRGSRGQAVLRWKHDRLPLHGQGRDLAAKQWRELAQQLISQGILRQDDGHGGLALGPRGKAVLDGAQVRVPATLAPPAVPQVPVDYERGLFEELRKLRANLARAADVPAFVVFSDRTLQEMARSLPQTPQALVKVPGIGERKRGQYGEQFLAVIQAYCQAHGLSERAPTLPRPTPAALPESSRRTEVGMFFASGLSVEDLARLYGVKPKTILDHLAEYHRAGNAVDGERLLPYVHASEAERHEACRRFEELGTQYLRPVYDALDGRVSFDDLRLLRIYYLSLKSPKRAPERRAES